MTRPPGRGDRPIRDGQAGSKTPLQHVAGHDPARSRIAPAVAILALVADVDDHGALGLRALGACRLRFDPASPARAAASSCSTPAVPSALTPPRSVPADHRRCVRSRRRRSDPRPPPERRRAGRPRSSHRSAGPAAPPAPTPTRSVKASACSRLRRLPPAIASPPAARSSTPSIAGHRRSVDLRGHAARQAELVQVPEQAEAGDVGRGVAPASTRPAGPRRRSASSSPRPPPRSLRLGDAALRRRRRPARRRAAW